MEPKDRVEKDANTPQGSEETNRGKDSAKPQDSARPTTTKDAPTCCKCNDAQSAKKHWWDKLKPYAEAIGVLVLATYGLYTVKFFYQSRAQFTQDERPYILIGDATKITYPPGQFRILVAIKNYGKTPALAVKITQALGTFGPYSLTPIEQRADTVYSSAIGQLGSREHNVSAIGQGAWFRSMSTHQTGSLDHYFKTAQWSWVVAGRVTYSDTIGNPYATDFCLYHGEQQGDLNSCDSHNDLSP